MHSPVMRFLHGLIWVITGLGSLHLGLMELGYNMLSNPMLAQWAMPINYIFGIAGAISLGLFVFHTAYGCHCGNSGACCK